MMVSVNSVQERTILFDMLPIKTIGFRSYDFRLQILGVAGQSMYAPARKAALIGVDGIVFVANSALDRQEENVQAFGEMTRQLVAHGVDISEIPLILQYNKRDLPEAAPIYAMDRDLNRREVPSFPATAASGEGVLETFGAVLEGVVRKLAAHHKHLDLPDGMTAEAWTQAALRGIFGRTSLGSEVAAETGEPAKAVPVKIKAPKPVKLQPPKPAKPAAPRRRKPKKIAITPPADAAARPPEPPVKTRPEPPPPPPPPPPPAPPQPKIIRLAPGKGSDDVDVRSPEVVAEAYAEASAELTIAMAEMREERDGAVNRLEEVQRTVDVSHDLLLSTTSEGDAVMRVLSCLAEAAEASHATLIRPDGGEFTAHPLPPLEADPIIAFGQGLDQLPDTEAQLHETARDSVFKAALQATDPPFQAVLAVPVRDAQTVFAYAMLYFAGEMALPPEHQIEHVGRLARIFSAPLELRLARQTHDAFDSLRALSRLGNASAAWSMAALSRGAPEVGKVDLIEVLTPIAEVGVDVTVESGAMAVSGPRDLVLLAIVSLVLAGETRRPGAASINVVQEPPMIKVEITVPGPAEGELSREDDMVSALVQWITRSCSGGRFETEQEGGMSVHRIWFKPA